MSVPNRQGGRRRRNKTDANGMPTAPRTIMVGDFDPEAEESEGNLVPAPEPDPDWHPVATNFYEGLRNSAQRLYYEPSDWSLAYLLCEQLTRELNPKFVGFKKVQGGETISGLPVMVDEEHYESMPLSGGSMSSTLRTMEQLMVTEPARRKARVEIERNAVVEDTIEGSIVSDRLTLLQGGQEESA